jgi:hypothetical protein
VRFHVVPEAFREKGSGLGWVSSELDDVAERKGRRRWPALVGVLEHLGVGL